jgi:hypothetical protein
MFLESASTSRDLFAHEDFIDFGFMDFKRLSDGKTLTIENKFPFEVQASWVLLPVTDKVTGKTIDNPFKVSPAKAVIPANSKYEFAAKFMPYEPDSYFFQYA